MTLNAEAAAALAEDAATLAVLQDRELTPAALAELKDLGFPDNLGLSPHDEAGRTAFAMMRDAIKTLPTAPDTAFCDSLAADFAAIYLTGALGASPYESFWLSDDHLLCQDAMWEVRAAYTAAGLAVPNWRLRPDDHLVYQLQFLSRVLARIGEDQDWRSLASFLDDHLLRWLPAFASRVAVHCDTAFYATLVLLTDAWCQQLRGIIARHLGEPRPTREQIEDRLRQQRNPEVPEFPLTFIPGAGGVSW